MSDFRGYVCWDPSNVRDIINPTAEAPSEAVFLATHHPRELRRADQGLPDRWRPYDQESFLSDFLADRPFTFVPVTGESGSGKSHLVRWLGASIERTAHRHIVLIPKNRTNLRAVIELILGGLQDEAYEDLRSRLDQAPDTVSIELARHNLLSQLLFLAGPQNTEHAESTSLTPQQTYIRANLEFYLGDPLIQNRLTRPGEVIDRLVNESRSGRTGDKETPYEFRREDLVFDFAEISSIGSRGQQFYQHLSSRESLQDETVRWLNEFLPTAIRRTYGLRTNELRDLINDLRRQLLAEGKELILLIEDFAVLQAIQGELLDALLEDTVREGKQELCTIRTALAVTSGYFDRLDTARTRATFFVSLDVKTDESGGVTRKELFDFYGRYLNATRLGSEALEVARERSSAGTGHWLPNACETCPHRTACHAAFGTSPEGFGLYPFNAIAVEKTARHVTPSLFNPRSILTGAVRFTLEQAAEAVAEGAFPTPEFGERFNLSLLTAENRVRLNQEDPEGAERRGRLLNVWADVPPLVNLPRGVHDAFALPPLVGLSEGGTPKAAATPETTRPMRDANRSAVRAEDPSPPVDPEPRPSVNELRPPVNEPPLVRLLNDWSNGATLVQTDAQRLRKLIHDLVTDHIDWESEGLSDRYFKNSVWTTDSVQIEGWSSRASAFRRLVRLPIPLQEGNRADTAFALQAAVLAEHHGHWNFENGYRYLAALRRHLSEWSECVLKQLRTTERDGLAEDPVPALVEMLVLSSRLDARMDATVDRLAGWTDSMLAAPSSEGWLVNREGWGQLQRARIQHHMQAVDALLARAGLAKGVGRTRMLDLVQIAPVVQEVRDRLVPEKSVGPVEEFRDLRSRLEEIPTLVTEALATVKQDLDSTIALVEAEQDQEELANRIDQAVTYAAHAGVFNSPRGSEALELPISTFESGVRALKEFPLQRTIADARAVLAAGESAEATQRLAAWDPTQLRDLNRLLGEINVGLTRSIEYATSKLQAFGAAGSLGIENLQRDIRTHLEYIRSALASITGGDGAS